MAPGSTGRWLRGQIVAQGMGIEAVAVTSEPGPARLFLVG
jgi:hypothetical protein